MWYVKPKNELYHHGIKGQKWGVRRFQNEDGSYTEAGRKRYGIQQDGSMSSKGAKKWYKDHYIGMLNKHIKYLDEYDRTDEGRKKQEAYGREIDKMESDEEYSSWDRFYKLEEDYLKSGELYAGKKLLQEYGDEKFSLYATRGNIERGRQTVEQFAENEWRAHTY